MHVPCVLSKPLLLPQETAAFFIYALWGLFICAAVMYNRKSIRKGGRKLGKIIAVTNQKGGVGKTTSCVNLSAAVAAHGKRVLLCDIDAQGNATTGTGLNKNTKSRTMFDVLAGDTPIEEIFRPGAGDNLTVAPANMELVGAEVVMANLPNREKRLKEQLNRVRDQFDFIFIDCPPSLGLLTLNALTAADTILVPIQCEYYALEGLTQLMSTVRLVRQRLNPALDVEGVLLTMVTARTNLGNAVANEVRKFFKGKVYQTTIPRNVRLSEAPSYGKPINLYDRRSAGSKAYAALAEEFLTYNGGEA